MQMIEAGIAHSQEAIGDVVGWLRGYYALGVFDCFSIAETTRQCRAIGHIALILSLFLDDDLKRVVFHHSPMLLLKHSLQTRANHPFRPALLRSACLAMKV
jgi:hypothetical protein